MYRGEIQSGQASGLTPADLRGEIVPGTNDASTLPPQVNRVIYLPNKDTANPLKHPELLEGNFSYRHPEVLTGALPLKAFEEIGGMTKLMKPGQSMHFDQEFGREGEEKIYGVEFYPFGIDVINPSKYFEIVNFYMTLSNEDHTNRFFDIGDVDRKGAVARVNDYWKNILSYSLPDTAIMIIRDKESKKIAGIRNASRDREDPGILEVASTVGTEHRRLGIATKSLDTIAGILYFNGAREIFGSHFGNNRGCFKYWQSRIADEQSGKPGVLKAIKIHRDFEENCVNFNAQVQPPGR